MILKGWLIRINWLICCSFLIGGILEVMPWPEQYYMFRPSWILLILFYWIMALPRRVNVGYSFFLGMAVDLITGGVLGVRALTFSLVSYMVIYRSHLLKNLALWQQATLVMLFSALANLMVFWIRFILSDITFQPEIFWGPVIDGILWPWLFLLLRKVQHSYTMQ